MITAIRGANLAGTEAPGWRIGRREGNELVKSWLSVLPAESITEAVAVRAGDSITLRMQDMECVSVSFVSVVSGGVLPIVQVYLRGAQTDQREKMAIEKIREAIAAVGSGPIDWVRMVIQEIGTIADYATGLSSFRGAARHAQEPIRGASALSYFTYL